MLYYYFAVKRGVRAKIIGYDLKEDVVEHCNEVAARYGYSDLHFVVADVTRDVLYREHIDMLVTLHACDVATDYALHYAISRGVEHIFSVPCCQHEVNKTIQKGGDFDILLSHGLFQERFSALLTDAIRAAVLEDEGYDVDVIEFIDFAHSPKNLMLRCHRTGHRGTKKLTGIRRHPSRPIPASGRPYLIGRKRAAIKRVAGFCPQGGGIRKAAKLLTIARRPQTRKIKIVFLTTEVNCRKAARKPPWGVRVRKTLLLRRALRLARALP